MDKNPWLEIGYEDYVGHMDNPEVDQYKMINNVFKNSLDKYSPKSILVPGCTIGNGFEHINWLSVENVIALDINPKYLDVIHERFGSYKQLQIINADLNSWEPPETKFDMIYAALLFEYVNVKTVLGKLCNMMKGNSRLITLLQCEIHSQSKVSKTRYSSLEKLNPIMELVNISKFETALRKSRLAINNENNITLKSGKVFKVYELGKLKGI